MVYTIGVSSGWWGIAKTPDLLGLGYKAMSAATYGVNFVQLDIESPSEFMEPLLEQQLAIAREDLGLNYGIHGEFDLKMEHAVKDIYDIYHERLIDHIRGAVRTKSSYMHFHASSEPPPTIGSSMLGYRFQRLVAPNGNTLYDLLNYFTPVKEGDKTVYKVANNYSEYSHLRPDQIAAIRRIMLENYIAGGGPEATDPRHREFQDMANDYLAGIAGIAIGEVRENISKMMWRRMRPDLEAKLRAAVQIVNARLPGSPNEQPIPTENFISIYNTLINEGNASIDTYVTIIVNHLRIRDPNLNLDNYFRDMRNSVREELYDRAEEFIKDEMGKKYVPFFGYDERLAYEIVGRLMEGSQQWKTICYTKYVRDQLTSQFKSEDPTRKFSDNDITVDNLLRSHDRRVQALVSTVVAMEYIDGHFSRIMQYRDPDNGTFTEEKDKSGKPITVKEYIKEHKFVVTFETPQIEQKQEGLLRIVRSEHIYHLVKKIRAFNGDQNFLKDYVFISLDFEHMLTHNLNIDLELDELPQDGGALCKVIHVGQPKPIHPAHAPIYVGSEAQELIYRYLFKLRSKGFKDGWVVFERGGGQSPLEWMRSSVYAMRLIVEYLEKETNPDKLPVEFYGVSPESEFSEQRQMDVIHLHFFAPLAGTLAIPEEEHTFLGRLATERPGLTPEKWKKEELR